MRDAGLLTTPARLLPPRPEGLHRRHARSRALQDGWGGSLWCGVGSNGTGVLGRTTCISSTRMDKFKLDLTVSLAIPKILYSRSSPPTLSCERARPKNGHAGVLPARRMTHEAAQAAGQAGRQAGRHCCTSLRTHTRLPILRRMDSRMDSSEPQVGCLIGLVVNIAPGM